jgi:hypothetical protein
MVERTPSLDGCLAKLERAEWHIGMVKASVIKSTPLMNLQVEQTLGSNHALTVSLVATEVPELPRRWSLDIGDAVQNARAALDYLAYELVALESGGAYYERTQFPIAWEPDEHSSRDRETIDRLGRHWEVIREYQPYGRPADVFSAALGILHDHSNQDKHRLLVPVSVAADLNNTMLVHPGKGVTRRERALFHTGVIEPGTALVREEFVALDDNPTVFPTPGYTPAVCFADWPTLPVYDTLQAIHRKAQLLINHFVELF